MVLWWWLLCHVYLPLETRFMRRQIGRQTVRSFSAVDLCCFSMFFLYGVLHTENLGMAVWSRQRPNAKLRQCKWASNGKELPILKAGYWHSELSWRSWKVVARFPQFPDWKQVVTNTACGAIMTRLGGGPRGNEAEADSLLSWIGCIGWIYCTFDVFAAKMQMILNQVVCSSYIIFTKGASGRKIDGCEFQIHWL